jgi:hypothetical protein
LLDASDKTIGNDSAPPDGAIRGCLPGSLTFVMDFEDSQVVGRRCSRSSTSMEIPPPVRRLLIEVPLPSSAGSGIANKPRRLPGGAAVNRPTKTLASDIGDVT